VARWNNDLQKQNYEWFNKLSGQMIANVVDGYPTTSTDIYCSIGYPADLNSVVVVESDKSVTEITEAGGTGSSGIALTYDPQPRCITTDSAGRVIVAVGAAGDTENIRLQYSTDISGAWSTTTGPTLETPSAISSEGSAGTGVMVGGGNGGMYYASVASGTLAAVTTPGYVETGANRKVVGVIRLAADTWMIVTIKGEVFTTANNGSTWTAGTDNSATEDINDASYNENTGRIVAVGDTNFFYSDDYGATWTTATKAYTETGTLDGECVEYVGGLLWISGWITGANGKLYGSYDNGETWFHIDQHTTNKYAVYDIGCARNAAILGADGGDIYRTPNILGGVVA
jgi:photosystem II stability/assembly factor-like uncharacterized protein